MKTRSKKILITILLVFCLFLLMNNKAYAETTEFEAKYSYNDYTVEQVLNLVNQRRAENGLPALSWDYNLEKVAMQRAAEVQAYFSHTRTDGRGCVTAFEDLGISGNYDYKGENIADGYMTAENVMNAWMNSPGHRANILNANYNAIGVARIVGDTWVQVFGHNTGNINSNKVVVMYNVTSDRTKTYQQHIMKIRVSDLYVTSNYDTLTMEYNSFVMGSSFFKIKSRSIPQFNLQIDYGVPFKITTNNPSAISVTGYYFSMKDYGSYTVTGEIAGKKKVVQINGVKPNMAAYTFNAKYYADHNADLKAAFGYNEASLRAHWENCGINEGRQASPVFSVRYYLDNNPDLKAAFGNNYRAALNHFATFGASEGRKSSPEYWGNYYSNKYSDLAGFSACKLLMHFYNNGYSEGRKANDGSVAKPAATPAPAQPAAPAPASWNGNIVKIAFNASFCGSIYPDLAGMNADQLYSHWVNFGIREGRQASLVYDPVYYLNSNSDLKAAFGNNYAAAFEHFKTCGIKEGRKSSRYFDGQYYMDSHSDLRAAFGNKNYGQGAEHFVDNGIREGRCASRDFNVLKYKNNYRDLSSAFGNNFTNYYIHFITFGINEGRKGI